MSTLKATNIKNESSASNNIVLDSGGGVVVNNGVTLGTGTTISSPASDTFAISTNGSERVRVDSSGKVGLGTNVISSKVNVLGTGNGSTGSTGLSDSSVASSLLLRASSNSSTSLVLGTRDTGGQYIQGLYDANPVVSLRDIQINPYGGSVGIGTFADAFGGAPGNSTFVVGTSGVERARVDSSGRLLVGTSSSPSAGSGQYSLLVVQGYQGAPTGQGDLSIQRGEAATAMSSGDDLGYIKFNDSVGNSFAYISAIADATPGTNDYPGRLVFSTTADGASSPTERMRIRSDGRLLVPGVYAETTGGSANVNVQADGLMQRGVSSIKYKKDVETLEDSYADALLSVRPVWYRSTCQADNPAWGWWGFIAEEVAEIDPRLVHWKTTESVVQENGTLEHVPCEPEPEGVAYDRFVPHLLNLIKRQGEVISELQTEVAALKAA